MIEFLHIAPTPHLDLVKDRKTHLLLAHLVEEDSDYREFYATLKEEEDVTYILDNSAFEMYKQGRPMYPSDNLIDMGNQVNADYIVMSDYPDMPCTKTIEAAKVMAPQLRDAGFKTFFVPQSKIGDIKDYVDGCMWAATSKEVDYIGISILGVPNAYGVERNNKLQRFVSRWKMLSTLHDRGFFSRCIVSGKRIHMLGMVDGPNEIELVRHLPINTWDSSAGVWAGLNGIPFDGSPTGLVDGKFELEVDFNHVCSDNSMIELARDNMHYIDQLCEVV